MSEHQDRELTPEELEKATGAGKPFSEAKTKSPFGTPEEKDNPFGDARPDKTGGDPFGDARGDKTGKLGDARGGK